MRGELRHYADRNAVAQAAAAYFVELAQQAIENRGRFTVALSGGSTPRSLHGVLAEHYRSALDWARVIVFWGDERSVGPEHPDSNYHMARETLLNHVPVAETNIHRIEAEKAPEAAVEGYTQTLKRVFNLTDKQFPRFDLVLLGMGDDGHTASLFPHTAALNEQERLVTANYVEKLETWRFTLTVPTINHAANAAFLITGEGKAQVLREVLHGPQQPMERPSQLIAPHQGTLVYFVDDAAARFLTG